MEWCIPVYNCFILNYNESCIVLESDSNHLWQGVSQSVVTFTFTMQGEVDHLCAIHNDPYGVCYRRSKPKLFKVYISYPTSWRELFSTPWNAPKWYFWGYWGRLWKMFICKGRLCDAISQWSLYAVRTPFW